MPTKLGQNFLQDKDIARKIVDWAELEPHDLVIEVGPGKGILTADIAKRVKKIIAVEIDENLAALLKNKFKDNKNIEIINSDILKTDLKKLITSSGLRIVNYHVIANIPYYITSLIIRFFLENSFPPSKMLLMVQKEVAERITAAPGKMSLLAVSVQYYAQAELLFSVDKKFFSPIPSVDSAVIRITRNPKSETFSQEKNRKFFRIVRAGFSAKRKTLVNNLSNSLHLDKKLITKQIKKISLSETVRAQELSLTDWKKLVNLFSEII